jgi:phosphate/sulfate permease
MGAYEQTIHLLNFIAPALFMSGLCSLMARVLERSGWPRSPWGWLTQTLVGAALGSGVLLAGLWWWGVDGKMASYALLVLCIGTAQWLMCRAWRRV